MSVPRVDVRENGSSEEVRSDEARLRTVEAGVQTNRRCEALPGDWGGAAAEEERAGLN